ncbi:MAG: TonB-dependent receptor [Myxococcales bacterium]|nr:TonB-dependent receptor [Myxococcales bacterium]
MDRYQFVRLGGSLLSLCLGVSTLLAEPAASEQLSGQEIEQIVVTGSRIESKLSDAPIATEVIDRTEIEVSGVENLADLLEEYGGLDVSRSLGRANIRIQGLDSKYVLVLVNGQRTTGRVDGAIDLTRFAAEDIERVEIVRGSSSALYGTDAIGGVINIITRKAQESFEAAIRASYGSFNTVDVHGNTGASGNRWSARFTAGLHRGDGYDLSPESPATTGAAFDTYNVSAQADWSITDTLRIFSNGEYRFSDQWNQDPLGPAVLLRRNRTETGLATMGGDWRPNETTQIQLTGHYTQYRDQFVLDQEGGITADDRQVTTDRLGQLTLQYNQSFGDSHQLTIGTEGYYEGIETARIPSGERTRQRLAAYIQHQWTILEETKLVLVPGGRIDTDTQFGTHPTPKISVRMDPHKTITLRASYGWGFRAPSFQELYLFFQNPGAGYVVDGNPDLGPEKSRSANINVEYRPFRGLTAFVNIYRNDVENLINAEPVNRDSVVNGPQPELFRYENIARAYTQGIEASLGFRFRWGLGVDMSYTLTDTYDEENDRVISGRARHRGSTTLSYGYIKWGLSSSMRASLVGTTVFIEEDDQTELDPYLLLDIRLSKTLVTLINTEIDMFAGAENLLNTGEERFNPIQPRTFYVGARGKM